MSELPAVKIQYGFNKSYPGSWTAQGVGAQTAPYKRGWYPQLPVLDAPAAAFCRVKKWLYIGGTFTTVNGAALPYLTRVSLEDGVVDAAFLPALDAAVAALATDGENLYVGGSFTVIGGQALPYLARLDVNGNVDVAFQPTPDAAITALTAKTGAGVYAIGSFTAIGGEARVKLAELGKNGLATAFNVGGFTVGVPMTAAYELAQNMLYIGGTFVDVAGTGRTRLAKVHGDTGALQAWNPTANNTVRTLALNYPLVYAGGDFTAAGGSARTGLVCIDQAGVATSWDVSAFALQVYSMALDSNKGIMFAGAIAGAIGLKTDTSGVGALAWNANPDGAVEAVLHYKSTVFLGGNFTTVDGIGATTVTNASAVAVPFPLFRDADTIFVKQTGAYSGAVGSYADPLRSMDYALGTGQSFDDQSAAGNNLTVTGVVQNPPESWTDPSKGYWMAGPFNDSNYLNVPAAIGTAFAASNAFTVQFDVWLESLAAINTVWDWENATGEVIVSVATTGAVNFNIHGTTATSAAGVITARGWYTITAEKNPSGNTKRVWVSQPGKTPVLVINTTQSATLGANTSDRLGRDRANASRYLVGFMGPVFFMNAAVASTLGPRMDWRDSYSANCKGYYPMQTKCALEGDVDFKYVCILDSEVYEEWFNWHVEGTSLYANDGCAPTFKPRVGAKPGTYGARVAGREVFFTPSGANAYIYVSKTGSDSTGARGNSALPFLTIAGACAAAGVTANDVVQFLDSAVYSENVNPGTSVYLQAASGQVPTITRGVAGTFLQGGILGMSGILLRCPAESAGTFAPAGYPVFYDCTLNNVAITNTTQVVLVNCVLAGASTVSDNASTLGSYFHNCYLSGTSKVTADDSPSLTALNCTFALTGTVATDAALEIKGSNSSSKNFAYVASCLFTLAGKTLAIYAQEIVGASSNKAFIASRCSIDASGLTTYNVSSVVYMGGNQNLTMCLYVTTKTVIYGPCNTPAGFALVAVGAAYSNFFAGFRNCAMLGAANGTSILGFHGNFTQHVTAASGIYNKIKNCSSINAAYEGFYFYDTAGTTDFSGLIDSGSTSGIAANSAVTVNYSTTNLIGANVTGTSFLQATPGVLGGADGDENLALSSVSPGLFNGDANGLTDQGINWAWNTNQAASAVFNGITFDGDKNMGAGLANVSGVATGLEFLTFTALGVAGLLGKEGASLLNCEGASTNGPAFRIGGVSSRVRRSIAWGCAGTGFLFGAPDLLDENNSSWGCENGHHDTASAVGTLTDSIHSDNGTDVTANEPVTYSAVGSIGADVDVDSTSTRKNPLYIDPYTGNLALQTLAAAYPFNSPAKGTGTDGADMGAYEAEYGTLTETYIELSMKGADAESGWLNPTDIPWQYVAIKGSEGEKPAGSSYSTAKATKRQWELRWGGTANMPQTQLIALNEVYRDAGPIKVAFDGRTFIPCIVLKSNAAKNDQIDGLYTNSDVPRPLDSLILREL